uniref:Uncharacterized protein n=1 Tax=Staphylococcus aureus TaxID=1280 RepID=Q8VVT7_STAAU|nr:unnamed protein product [Staphylococcus aureus]
MPFVEVYAFKIFIIDKYIIINIFYIYFFTLFHLDIY